MLYNETSLGLIPNSSEFPILPPLVSEALFNVAYSLVKDVRLRDKLTQTKDVWFRDASFVDTTGSATFTEAETKQLTAILSEAGKTFQQINSLTLNRIAANETVLTYIKTFNNSKVRAGQKITNTQAHTLELLRWVEAKLNKDIADVKKEETKRKNILSGRKRNKTQT